MSKLNVIYIGESNNVKRRIINNHCFGNVDISALRRNIAKEFGYEIQKEKNSKGESVYFLIKSNYELEITKYIISGFWKIIILDKKEIAKDFQYFLINKLKPLLNKEKKNYDINKKDYYESLLKELEKQRCLSCDDVLNHKNLCKPGIYVFCHHILPTKRN